MQELLLGSWGPQLLAYGRQLVSYSVLHPWRVFTAALVAYLLVNLMFRKRSSGTADGLDLSGLDFGGDGDGCGD